MKLTPETINLICDLEYIIGNSCCNSEYDWGNTSFRYPVRYLTEDGKEYHKTRSKVNLFDDLTTEQVESLNYKMGANQLYIGHAIIQILNELERRYDIDFNK